MASNTRTRRQQQPASQNGKSTATPEQLQAAIDSEEQLRAEAEQIRGEATELTPALLRELRPLLRRPIPEGFIQNVGVVTGKPYDSTGIRSVQVQMDRLDNVLGPDWWGYERTFSEGGKLCEVVAWIGPSRDGALVVRDSFGGVDRGSTLGNVYKGSFTNAAKPALARLGPGWEVYVGAADFDPDTDAAAAEQQGKGAPAAPVATVSADDAAMLRDAFDRIPGERQDKARRLKMWLGSKGVTGIGSVNQALAKLTPALAAELDGELSRWAEKEAAGGES